MAQVPGLGLDQSQLADVINQQYKGYSQKQRNQMMQAAAASPDNWGAITQQANKTATQPTEFLGAGRTSDIPKVYKDGELYTAIDPNTFNSYTAEMPEYGQGEFAPTYTNAQAKYYNRQDLSKLNNLVGVYDYLKKINPLRTKTETWAPSAEQLASRKWWDSTPLRPDPSLGYREIQGGVDENGVASDSIWVRDVADPLSYDQFWSEYGATPEGGWSDSNTKRSFNIFNRTKPILQRWQDDASYLPNFSLYGSGSPEDMQRGFNVLQRMSPQNIGEFWSLSPDVQKGMLEHPAAALQWMRATANPANRDWLSVGAEGGFSDFDAYKWDPNRGLTVDPSKYMQINDSSSGLLGGLNDLAEGIAKWTDPVFYKSMGGGTENSLWKDLTNEGLYGAVFNKLDPILDKIDPGHDWAQDQIAGAIGADSQKEAFNQIAPLVLAAVTYGVGSGGAAAGSAAGGTTTGSMASSIMQGVQALNSLNSGDFAGAALSGLGSANVNPSSAFTEKLTGLGMSPDVAKMVGNFGVSAASNLMRGQDMNSALASALFSTASGKAGSELGKALSPTLGEIGSRAIGGAASGGLNSLFNKNNVVAGSLFGGMSGGLHGFLNSTDKQNNTFNKEQNIKNQQQAQNLTKLARMFVKK